MLLCDVVVAALDAELVRFEQDLGVHVTGRRLLRDGEREMVDATRVLDRRRRAALAPLVGEDGDEASVARVEVEVALVLRVEVRLLEHERHAEHAFPEVDRRLPVGPDERDVVDALGLDLSHQRSTSWDLYSLRCRAPYGTNSTR